MFDQSIILVDDTVRLRPIRADDVDAMAAAAFHDEIWTYFVAVVRSRAELQAYVTAAVQLLESGVRYTFVIEDRRSGHIVGSSAYGNYSPKDGRIEIGWTWITPKFHGTCINARTKYLLLRHAFEMLGLQRVEFKTDVLNQRARAALRKIGAVEEGTLRSHTLMPGGRRRDTIYYSILAEEWPDLRNRVFSNYASSEVS